jgi:hypothetical protein
MKKAIATAPGLEPIYQDLTPEELVVHETGVVYELEYDELRRRAFSSIEEQLDMQYWDSVNGTTVWADHIAAVKLANPKPE